MIRVCIEGYQVIKGVDLDISGITMIVGSTNHGKSALCRALDSAMFSNSGDDFINFDMERCKVSLNFPAEEDKGALDLTWSKGRKGGSEYTINGVEYKKTGKKAPEDLEKAGIKDVVVRDIKERLLYWEQMQEPFLVFRPPTYIFDFVSQLMQDKKLTPVLKQMIIDSRTIRQDLISLEGQVTAYQTSLDDLKKRESILFQIGLVEGDFIALRKNKVRYSRLREILQALDLVNTQLSTVDGIISALELNVLFPIAFLGDLSGTVKRHESLTAVNSTMSSLNLECSMSDLLINKDQQVLQESFCIDPLQVKRYGSLKPLWSDLFGVVVGIRDFNDMIDKLYLVTSEPFPIPLHVSRYEKIRSLCDDLLVLEGSIKNDLAMLFKLENIVANEELIDPVFIPKYQHLKSIFSELQGMEVSINLIDTVSFESSLTLAVSELESYKKEIGICPMCGSDFSLHEGGMHVKSNS